MKIFLVGGFLGSGKTTAIINACLLLARKQIPVAVITNDQGDQQVDSAFVKSFGIPLAEVSDGCFCCNYKVLDKQIHRFVETINPEIIFAESVGSCTDLVATVTKPLMMAMTNASITVSVFIDASLMLAFIEGRASFIADEVRYIYKKQIEEADLLVINKIDCVKSDHLNIIGELLEQDFPGKKIVYQHSHDPKDIENWLSALQNFTPPLKRGSLNLDYNIYADGEASLAWMDESVVITGDGQNALVIADDLIREIHAGLMQQDVTIGHLKFFIECNDFKKKVSITTTSPLYEHFPEANPGDQASVLINARVQADPTIVEQIVNRSFKSIMGRYHCRIIVQKKRAFKPGYPTPTYRIP